MGLVAVLLAVAMFMLPSIVAYCRQHPSRESILILNLFLGATGIAWLILLFWATGGIKNKNKKPSALALEEPRQRIGSIKNFFMNALETGLSRTGLKRQLRPSTDDTQLRSIADVDSPGYNYERSDECPRDHERRRGLLGYFPLQRFHQRRPRPSMRWPNLPWMRRRAVGKRQLTASIYETEVESVLASGEPEEPGQLDETEAGNRTEPNPARRSFEPSYWKIALWVAAAFWLGNGALVWATADPARYEVNPFTHTIVIRSDDDMPIEAHLFWANVARGACEAQAAGVMGFGWGMTVVANRTPIMSCWSWR